VRDGIRLVQTGPDVPFAIKAEPIAEPCTRTECCTRNRRVRNGDVAIRSVEVEEVEDIGILAGRHKDPLRADGGANPGKLPVWGPNNPRQYSPFTAADAVILCGVSTGLTAIRHRS
jgi:hypothetical protein